MKHAIIILGVATLLAGVAPAVHAQSSTQPPLSIQNQEFDLSQQGEDKLKNGDYEGALKIYNQVLQLNAKDDKAYVNRGLARFNLGNKSGAMEDFDQALELNPNNAEAYRQRGGLYLIMGDKRKARQDFQQVAKINRGGSVNSQQGGGASSPGGGASSQLQQ